jgi:hypothetical protein
MLRRFNGKVEGGGVLAASITSVADTWLVWKALVPLPMMLLCVSVYLSLRMWIARCRPARPIAVALWSTLAGCYPSWLSSGPFALPAVLQRLRLQLDP